MYKVLLLNDDYTPMEFVVMVLQRFFNMDIEQATQVMLHVHQQGVGVCGVFSYEVADTKVNQVMDAARQNQHPLQCTLEKACSARLRGLFGFARKSVVEGKRVYVRVDCGGRLTIKKKKKKET